MRSCYLDDVPERYQYIVVQKFESGGFAEAFRAKPNTLCYNNCHTGNNCYGTDDKTNYTEIYKML